MIDIEQLDGRDLVAKWKKELEREKREHEKWRDKASKIEEKYYDEKDHNPQRINILFSNVQVQHAALLSQPPNPEVRRRHKTDGKEAKDAAQMIEEAISFAIDAAPFKEPLDLALEDALTSGLGVARVNYDPTIETEVEMVMGEAGMEAVETRVITDQALSLEFFHSKNFRWQPAKRWEDVDWIAFTFMLSKDEIREQFGVEMDVKAREERPKKCKVHEIWDKKNKLVVVIGDEYPEPLEVRPDQLGLKDFFPVAAPMMPYQRKDKYCPIPEFTYYQSWSDQLNELSNRYKTLVRAAKAAGIADAHIAERVAAISTKDDGEFIPIPDLAGTMQLLGAGKLDDLIHYWPVEDILRLAAQVKDEIEFCKAQTYEITGISDIIRGATQASETATAQQIKGQWANVRLTRKQNMLNRFCRQTFRIMAELISEHYKPEILARMTSLDDQEVMSALPLIQDDLGRAFLIDVETDSTIVKDELEERQSTLEMMQQFISYAQHVQPMIQQGLMPADMGKEFLLALVRGWKQGRQLEEYILGMDGTQEQFAKMQQQMQQMQQQLQQQIQQYAQAYQQSQQQVAQLTKQVQAFDQAEQQRKNAETQADNQLKAAQAFERQAEGQYELAKAESERTQAAVNSIIQ